MIKLPNKRISLESYLKKLIVISLMFLTSLLFQTYVIEVIELKNLYETNDFDKFFWYDYYSVFHYNLLPVLLLIWVIILSVNRLHDSNKSGYLIFAPLINLYWLFSTGDANENRFGLPQNNNKSKIVYFDDLQKSAVINKGKLILLSVILMSIFTISYLLVNSVDNSMELNQLFTISDINTNPISKETTTPDDKLKINPLKWEYINGKIKFLKNNEEKDASFLVFDKNSNLIRRISNDNKTFYYYHSNILDSIHVITPNDISKIYYYYKKIKDSTIIEEKEFVNKKLQYECRLSKINNLTIEKKTFFYEGYTKPQVVIKKYLYNNFNQLYELSHMSGDKDNYEYDLNNNLTHYYENDKLLAKFEYDNNQLKYFELIIPSEYSNGINIEKLFYKYNTNYNSYPNMTIEGNSINRVKLNKEMSYFGIEIGDGQYKTFYGNDMVYKKDYKNNICELKSPKIFEEFTEDELDVGILSSLNENISRTYSYYDSYFDLYVKLFKRINE